MANGKGALECRYCAHAGDRRCNFHGVELPESDRGWNRVCINFQPDEAYWRDNSEYSPPARRFTWFCKDLEPGVLYHFMYNAPETAEQLTRMRYPDYLTGGWKT